MRLIATLCLTALFVLILAACSTPPTATPAPTVAPEPTATPLIACYLRADGSAYTYSVCGADGHPDGPADTYAYVRVNRDTGAHSHSYPNPCAYAYPNTHADSYCNIDSRADGDAGSHAYRRPYSDTYTPYSYSYQASQAGASLQARSLL